MLLNILGVLVILGLVNLLILVRAKEGWEDEGGFHEVQPPVIPMGRKSSPRRLTR